MDSPFLVIAIVIVVGFGCIYVMTNPLRLAYLMVIAMFVTRPTLAVGGFNLRLELLVGALCALSLIANELANKPKMARLPKLSMISIALCILWFGFSAFGTFANAPDLAKSFSVLIWCMLNFVSAIWIARNPQYWKRLFVFGSVVSLVSSLLAIALWAGATAGLFKFGVQVDPAYGGYAAYDFSLEANILGGVLCLWGLVAAYNPLGAVSTPLRLILVSVTPVAIFATHTRAALLAYMCGLALLFVARRSSRKLVVGALVIGGLSALTAFFGSSDVGLSKFASMFDTSTGTGGLRFRVNTVAVTQWWNSAGRLVGLGWNSFGQRNYDPTQPGLRMPGYIGNLPLQIVYDGGIVSAVLVLVAAIAVITTFFRSKQFGIVACIAIPYLIFSISTSALWFLETWLFVGLAWGYSANVIADSKIPIQSDRLRSITTR